MFPQYAFGSTSFAQRILGEIQLHQSCLATSRAGSDTSSRIPSGFVVAAAPPASGSADSGVVPDAEELAFKPRRRFLRAVSCAGRRFILRWRLVTHVRSFVNQSLSPLLSLQQYDFWWMIITGTEIVFAAKIASERRKPLSLFDKESAEFAEVTLNLESKRTRKTRPSSCSLRVFRVLADESLLFFSAAPHAG